MTIAHRGGLAFAIFFAAIVTCTAIAHANAEFCPAAIQYSPTAPAGEDGRAAGLVFDLWGKAARTIVSATIIADTDGGWYTWDVENLPLTMVKAWAQSASLAVDFPKPVFVRHAWVIKAKTSGDNLFGWDALGEVACGVPGFLSPAYRPAKPRTAAGLQHVAATAIAPLYSTDCPHPFAAARVVHPVQPIMPQFVIRGIYITTEVEVVIGDHDNLLDASMYKSSKNPAIDESALAAARASSYQSATSYCQKVQADYLFRADFDTR
jgi:hypothetical protein